MRDKYIFKLAFKNQVRMDKVVNLFMGYGHYNDNYFVEFVK